MLRFILCPIISGGESGYRAAVFDAQNVNSSALIPSHLSGPDIGKPLYGYALCLCAATSVNILAQISNTYVFPDYNLDGRMDGMESVARAGLVQSVQAYDMDGNGYHIDATHADSDSYRDLIHKIGRQIDLAFSIDAINVGEVAA